MNLIHFLSSLDLGGAGNMGPHHRIQNTNGHTQGHAGGEMFSIP